MNRTSSFSLLLLTFLIFFTCCKKDEEYNPIPTVLVNFSINPNGTEYSNLNTVNGSEYLTGGYKGIIVFRKSPYEFSAFDRACPYDWEVNDARILVDTAGSTAYCPVCKSRFLLLDGTPFEGPSKYPLLQYQTTYDGNILYVSN